MAILRTLCIVLTALWLAGCGGSNSHLPRPRPPEPEDSDPVPAPPANPASPAANPATATGSAAVTPAAPPPGETAGVEEAPASSPAFAPADPAALQLQIKPTERGKPLTVAERRRLSIDRMRKITAALAAYAAEHGSLPPVATYDDEKCPMLSWRVLLLPYLGHQDLYAKFRLQEPFNSPHNVRMLATIPPVYQCPDRPDDKTNYLAPVGGNTAFVLGQLEGRPLPEVRDGLDNTVVLVEVDHAMAVEWSRPVEYTVYPQEPRRGLITLRDDGFFLGWGNGTVGCWPRTAPASRFGGLFTIAGNEQGLRALSAAAVAGEDTALAAAGQPGDPNATITEEDQGSVAQPYGTVVADVIQAGSPSEAAAVETSAAAVPRQPPPDGETRSRIAAKLRETYPDIAKGTSDKKEQKASAERLLADAGKAGVAPQEKFVMLEVATKLAAQAGDVATALQSLEQLAAAFELDLLPRQIETLEATARMALDEADDQLVLSTAQRLIGESLAVDQYDQALRLQAAALSAARRSKDSRTIAQLTQRRDEITAARQHYEEVRQVLDSVHSDSADPKSKLTVGTYLCFVKEQWERGLPLLAAGADPRLATLANQELAAPADAAGKMALADAWWQLAQDTRPHRRACERRAEHWYRESLPGLSDGLLKVRAELRLQELERKSTNK